MNTNETPAASASRHTPEPWYYESDGDGSALSHRDKYVCGDNGAGRILTLNDPSAASNAEVRANGKRICACVNACAGMADPEVEISGLRSRSNNIPAMCAEVETLRAEIAKLRAMLKGIAEDCGDDDQVMDLEDLMALRWSVKTNARAALKGGAK